MGSSCNLSNFSSLPFFNVTSAFFQGMKFSEDMKLGQCLQTVTVDQSRLQGHVGQDVLEDPIPEELGVELLGV